MNSLSATLLLALTIQPSVLAATETLVGTAYADDDCGSGSKYVFFANDIGGDCSDSAKSCDDSTIVTCVSDSPSSLQDDSIGYATYSDNTCTTPSTVRDFTRFFFAPQNLFLSIAKFGTTTGARLF